VVEKAKRLGIKLLDFPRRELEKEVEKR